MTPSIASQLLVFLVLAAPLVPASAQIYRCESENGVTVYQGSASGKNCQALDLAPLTTIPAPKAPPSRPAATAPGAPAASAPGAAAPGASGTAARSPSSFPRVDSSTQRARDNDRRRILEDELKKEESKLGELKTEYKDGEPDRLGSEKNYQRYLDRVQRLKEDIGRSEANIASIRRELATIKE